MREINFRAWDKEEKRMIAEFAHVGVNGRVYTVHHCGNEPDYEVMQYTGLKDRNGVDIYEGDILLWDHCAITFKSVVVFENGCFGVKSPHECGIKLIGEWGGPSRGVEVLGNIHENQELLEGV